MKKGSPASAAGAENAKHTKQRRERPRPWPRSPKPTLEPACQHGAVGAARGRLRGEQVPRVKEQRRKKFRVRERAALRQDPSTNHARHSSAGNFGGAPPLPPGKRHGARNQVPALRTLGKSSSF